MASKRLRNRRLSLLLLASALLSLAYLFIRRTPGSLAPRQTSVLQTQAHDDSVICPKSPLKDDDVFVIIRTGATEAREKLPSHFKTVLTCVPDFIIYSDMDEVVDGHRIYDVLDEVNKTIKSIAPEFEFYDHLQARGLEGLNIQTSSGSGPQGSMENPGWRLDKWKFLPMVDKALQQRPKASWYIFIEPDTYMVWSNMLEWLSKLDPKKPYYIGRHMYSSGVLFGHGGSGFVLSRPAMEKVSQYYRENQNTLDEETRQGWAGDLILGRVMKAVKIPMLWAYPHLQGDSLTSMEWGIEKLSRRAWCFAATTFHHMTSADMEMLWQFEQTWHQRNPAGSVLRFRDIFNSLIRHRLRDDRSGWDNMSTGTEYSKEKVDAMSPNNRDQMSLLELNAHTSIDMCKTLCHGKPDCIQFSFAPGRCSISTQLRLGRPADSQCLEYSNSAGKCVKTVPVSKSGGKTSQGGESSLQSGWMMDRIDNYARELDNHCATPAGNDWILK
ncbi:glycosyltransferase family 31 protein [Xylariaceae sp. FL0255]|nr:glycosyltransferase family 31 protein [Xylariaceae sp. FL0255]